MQLQLTNRADGTGSYAFLTFHELHIIRRTRRAMMNIYAIKIVVYRVARRK